ncbi:MAG: cyclase family protein [Alphaproteobacteria bacterium]|nr:cyclase family protein [Alphaproteobacteria bacterium]
MLWAAAGAASAQDMNLPSPFGPDDTIGAMNNLTPQTARDAARLVRTGQVYALGVVTGRATPAWPGRSYTMVVTQSNDGAGGALGANRVTGHDDLLITYLGIGSQIDGFGHMGQGHVYFNGTRAQDFFAGTGVTRFGVENIPPTATRGVLLDMTRHYGQTPVAPGTAFNRAEIEAAARAARVTLRRGDAVLFHTGWMTAKAQSDPQAFIAQQPGLGREGAEYLASLGVVMVGADTAALEAIPFEDANMPFVVHQTLLTKHGVHVLENINTAQLAADGATEFMFVLGQPRFEGAVQTVINPIAIR